MLCVKEDLFKCQICDDYFDEPVECMKCHNNFCKNCIEELKEMNDKNEIPFKCPYDKSEPFIYQKNTQLELILGQMDYVCSKCKTKLNGIKNYKEHKKKCENMLKCLICGLNFNEKEFIAHINNDEHKKIIIFSFDKSNQNKKWNEKFQNEIMQFKRENEIENNYYNFLKVEQETEKKIIKWKKDYENKQNNNQNDEIEGYLDSKIIYEFQNYLNIKSEENFDKIFRNYFYGNERFENFQNSEEFLEVCQFEDKPNPAIISFKDYIVPKKCRFLEKYNLYYCFRDNNLNCNCCKNHICQPGNCICKECMQTNLSYHGLKKYYLINKAGRACKYSNFSFHCHCRYERRTRNDNDVNFISMEWCHYPNFPCLACQEITILMDKYLDEEIIRKLKSKKD
jgi:hypothetical protein